MRSKLLFSVACALCGCALFSSTVRADGVDMPQKLMPWGPKFSIDLGRSIVGIIQGIINLTGDGNAKAELIAVQEGTNQNADGSAGWDKIPTGKAAGTALKNDVYSYVKSEILDQTDISKYSVLQSNLSSPKGEGNAKTTCESLGFKSERQLQTCLAVVDTFFADKGEENTIQYRDEILNNRQEYANMVAERQINLGYNVQQRVITDVVAAAQAPVSSDNEIGEIAIDGQTLDEMLKVTVADVALQIEMMEADAVEFLLAQPVEIMPETKPAEGLTQGSEE